MVQSKNVRHTLFVALFCLFLASMVWYWTESKIQFYLSGSKNKIEKIGQIKTVNFDTLVNFSGQLIWQPIDQGDFVYDGNSLQTDRNSSTEIILDDGQQLTVGTNSLVRFIKEDGAISLQLVEGQIELKSDSGLPISEKTLQFYLKTNDGKINTKSTHIKVEKKSKELKYEVVAGKPKVVDSEKALTSTKILIETKPKEIKKDLPPTVAIAPEPLVKPLQPVEPTQEISPPVVQKKFEPVEKPIEQIQPKAPPVVRAPAKAPKQKFLKLPEKVPLSAPKIKRVDVKVVE